MNTALMGPVFAQLALTLVVLLYMAIRRVSTLLAMKATPAQLQDRATIDSLPGFARYPSENLRNLFEVPMVFYVLCLSSMMTGLGGEMMVQLGWAYVGLRAVHSLIHCTYNTVAHRFWAFVFSNIVVVIMLVLMIKDYGMK